ncbi:Uridine-cytidine kinase C [Quillaja saponaria]|uniref:Uridine-cytidine kinase C n=1 Tax=Quillaja saponaria TaxID=32244 RepID=A0AAD7LF16_QUISA|nr:Uridine-cytidine kinase C [Quillaja saponaria]
MPSLSVITMDNYNDSSRIIDGNFDDPRLTDYDTLLDNIHGLKAGKPVQVPIYDFKSSIRTGYRTIEVLSSHIVIIEGIYALSERLRPLLDLRVSVTGGVHFDLVKRVLRDIQRAGQEPEEIIHQISKTVYPMHKAFIEPDLQTAHIKIINKFNPFPGFQNPTYILKSTRSVTEDQIKSVVLEEHTETREEIYDIYLLPPGEDPEACQSYLRMRNRDGKCNLMFEEWVMDGPFIISPRITFVVSVRLLGGLMALGYTIAIILKRSSHIFHDDRVQGKDRNYVKYVADELGLEGSYVPCTYIEQIQLERLVNDVMALPDDLKTKLSIDNELISSPKEALSRASADRRMKYLNRGMSHSYSYQGDKNMSRLTRIAINNRKFDVRSLGSAAALANQLNSKFAIRKASASQQNLALQAEACNGSGQTSRFMTGLGNGTLTGALLPNSSSSSQLAREFPLTEEVLLIAWGQRQIRLQLDNLSNLLHEYWGTRSCQGRTYQASRMSDVDSITISVALTSAVGALGVILFESLASQI